MRDSSLDTYESLTALRGILAVWVVLLHFRVVFEALVPGLSAIAPFAKAGYLAVPGFFVLSGFVLAVNYADSFRRPSHGLTFQFWLLRLARIYPVHFFTLVLMAAIYVAFRFMGLEKELGVFSLMEFLRNLFLVQMWRPSAISSWNLPSWSISTEWFAYLLFPLLVRLVPRAGGRSSLLLFGGSLIIAAVYYCLAKTLPFYGILIVVPFFICGMSIHMAVSYWRHRLRPATWHASLYLALAILPASFLLQGASKAACVIGLVALLILALALEGRKCHRLWRSRGLVLLGEASYSLYMTHWIVLWVMNKAFPSVQLAGSGFVNRMFVFAIFIAAIGFVCFLCYRLVEKPSRSGLNKMIRARYSAAPDRQASVPVAPAEQHAR